MTAATNEPTTAKTEDKMGWKPGDIKWTKSPPTARKIADQTRKSNPGK